MHDKTFVLKDRDRFFQKTAQENRKWKTKKENLFIIIIIIIIFWKSNKKSVRILGGAYAIFKEAGQKEHTHTWECIHILRIPGSAYANWVLHQTPWLQLLLTSRHYNFLQPLLSPFSLNSENHNPQILKCLLDHVLVAGLLLARLWCDSEMRLGSRGSDGFLFIHIEVRLISSLRSSSMLLIELVHG